MRKWMLVILFLAMSCDVMQAQFNAPVPDENGIYVRQKGVTPPQIVHASPADYPPDPSIAQVKHTCVVTAVIGAEGTINSVQLDNAHSSPFDAMAVDAVRASTFSAGNLSGKPVTVRIQVWVTFNGDGKPALPTVEHGGPFQNPKPRYTPDAAYTNEARKAHLNGDTFVSFVVTEEGTTRDVQVIKKIGLGLDEAAVKTILEWRFEPARLRGEPVPDRISTIMTFRAY